MKTKYLILILLSIILIGCKKEEKPFWGKTTVGNNGFNYIQVDAIDNSNMKIYTGINKEYKYYAIENKNYCDIYGLDGQIKGFIYKKDMKLFLVTHESYGTLTIEADIEYME